MIALLIAAAVQAVSSAPAPVPATPTASGTPKLGAIGKQAMPAKGCAAFLWAAADRTLVAMAVADTARIRVAVDGKPVDYARTDEAGPGGFGFAGVTTYRGGDLTIVLDMTVVSRDELTAGAMVPNATVRIDRPGRDTVVLPLAGMIGCA